MQDNTHEFIRRVEELAEEYGFEVSVKKVGKSVATFWELTIVDAEVVVQIGKGRCIVMDKKENVKQFKEPQSQEYQSEEYRIQEWEQESLDHIGTLLKMRTL